MPPLPLALTAGLFGSALLLTCSGRPEPGGARSPAPPDSLFADGGAVAMPDSLRAALVAADPLWETALRIHYDALVMDGHVDTPSLMLDEGYDLGTRHVARPASGHVDLPKMAEGGLDAPFFSIYVAASYGEGAAATDRALAMIAEVKRQVAAHADRVEVARTAADVRRITRAGRKAVLLGLEGGHAIQGSEAVLRRLRDAGIRYVTLTHTNTNGWADSSQDPPRHDGLSPQGVALVGAMN
ncbi:MAG TPA: membrane dipeptidase, partial [Rubricoccaceae bacterium]|nr:membrane dipeptidase [Rubricoccaceae bacterium]